MNATVAKPKQTRDHEHIKWTGPKIAKEFGMDVRTVGKRLKTAGLNPDKTMTTIEVVRALFGDYNSERLRKIREEADAIAIKNEQARGRLVEVQDVEKEWTNVCAGIKERMMTIAPKMEGRFGPELGKEVDREIREALIELSEKG